MADLYVRKTGRVCAVYETPFEDYDNPPEGTPQTLAGIESLEQLQMQYPGHKLHIVEPKLAPKALEKPSGLPLGAIIGALAGMDIPQAAKEALMARHAENPGQEAGKVVSIAVPKSEVALAREGVAYQDKMLQEFRLVIAGIGNAWSKEDAEAIGNFILAVDPSLEAELVKVKVSQTTRKFTL